MTTTDGTPCPRCASTHTVERQPDRTGTARTLCASCGTTFRAVAR